MDSLVRCWAQILAVGGQIVSKSGYRVAANDNLLLKQDFRPSAINQK